jgi:hypothetical protein
MAQLAAEMLLTYYERGEVPVFYDEKLLNNFPDQDLVTSLKDERQNLWNKQRLALLRQWLKKISNRTASEKKSVKFVLDPECVDHALKILNDLRLAAAVKYNVHEDEMNLMPDAIHETERRNAILIIHWCAALQHHLIQNLWHIDID